MKETISPEFIFEFGNGKVLVAKGKAYNDESDEKLNVISLSFASRPYAIGEPIDKDAESFEPCIFLSFPTMEATEKVFSVLLEAARGIDDRK